jgi:hypothetical protein
LYFEPIKEFCGILLCTGEVVIEHGKVKGLAKTTWAGKEHGFIT